MICNACGKEYAKLDNEICDNCIEFAKSGTYAICVRCDIISATFILVDDEPPKRLLFSADCLKCSNKIPTRFYESREGAEKAVFWE